MSYFSFVHIYTFAFFLALSQFLRFYRKKISIDIRPKKHGSASMNVHLFFFLRYLIFIAKISIFFLRIVRVVLRHSQHLIIFRMWKNHINIYSGYDVMWKPQAFATAAERVQSILRINHVKYPPKLIYQMECVCECVVNSNFTMLQPKYTTCDYAC